MNTSISGTGTLSNSAYCPRCDFFIDNNCIKYFKNEIVNYTTYLIQHAHDHRSPLTAISDGTDMLLEDLHLSDGIDKTNEYSGAIKIASNHLINMVNDLLKLNKVDFQKMALNEREICVSDLVSTCVTIMKSSTYSAGLDLKVKIQDNLPLLFVDFQRMTQVVLNLLSNAVKFTPKGGLIQLSASQNHLGQFILQISDNGIGMKESDIPKALGTFGQVGYGQNQTTPNSGLGLPLARRLVELHQGRLKIESKLGHGTIVTLTLPNQRWITYPQQHSTDPSPKTVMENKHVCKQSQNELRRF